jgi:hypothetical protein
VFLGGLALGTSLAVQLVGLSGFDWLKRTGFVLLLAGGIGLAFLMLARIICPAMRQFDLRGRLIWSLLALGGAVYLVLTLPLLVFPKQNVITIRALAEKNLAALASEVFLLDIQTGRVAAGPGLNRICEGNWENRQGTLVHYAGQPAQIECVIASDDRVQLTFLKHPWSGVVQVEYSGQVERQDLYAETSDQVTLSYPVRLTNGEKILRILLFLAATLAVGLVLLALCLWLTTHPLISGKKVGSKPISWVFYGLPMALIWFVFLLVYWPGFLSPDSVYQLEQIVEGQFYDWHPAFHTLLLWLLTRISFSPAPVAVVHILTLSGVLGWALSVIEEKGAPRWITGLLLTLLAFTPAAGLMALTMWKDILFSITVVALTVMAFLIFTSQGRWLEKTGHWISLGIVAALAALFRHNGAPLSLGFFVVLALFYLNRWRMILLSLLLALGIWLVVKGPLYSAVGVDTTYVTRGQFPVLSSLNISIVSWHIRSGTPLTHEEEQLYLEIYPRNAPRDTAAMINKEAETRDLALRLTQRNPEVTLAYFLQRSSIVFQVLRPPFAGSDNIFLEMYPNRYGIEQASLLPGLQPWIGRLVYLTDLPELDWIFWRNAFWMNLLIFACLVTWARTHSWKIFLVLVPILLNALPYAVYNPEYSARYILPTLLVGPIFATYLLLVKPGLDGPEGQQVTEPG